METSNKPTTEWKDRKRRTSKDDSALESMWDKCIQEKADEPMVAIRCRRHRKKVMVPSDWPSTCTWLCPKCYEKLSEKERMRYAPSVSHKLDFHKTEHSNPEVLTIPPEPMAEQVQEPIEKQLSEHSEKAVEEKFQQIPSFDDDCTFPIYSPDMANLMPQWRMVCQKCEKTRPVHKIWLDSTSKVLCPSCYSSMTNAEIRAFHATHPSTTAQVFAGSNHNRLEPDKPISSSLPLESEAIVYGGRCSNNFIMHATVQELSEAVKSGRLSKAGARIEMNRRKHSYYFSCLPEAEPVKACI